MPPSSHMSQRQHAIGRWELESLERRLERLEASDNERRNKDFEEMNEPRQELAQHW